MNWFGLFDLFELIQVYEKRGNADGELEQEPLPGHFAM